MAESGITEEDNDPGDARSIGWLAWGRAFLKRAFCPCTPVRRSQL